MSGRYHVRADATCGWNLVDSFDGDRIVIEQETFTVCDRAADYLEGRLPWDTSEVCEVAEVIRRNADRPAPGTYRVREKGGPHA